MSGSVALLETCQVPGKRAYSLGDVMAKKKVKIEQPEPTVEMHENDMIVPPGERPCPICKKKMTAEVHGRKSIDICAEHGVWLDSGELEQLIAALQEKALGQRRRSVEEAGRKGRTRGVWLGARALFRKAPAIAPAPKEEPPSRSQNRFIVPEGQRPCPICNEIMETSAQENIITDICDAHGIWFDSEELDEILMRVAARLDVDKSKAVRRAYDAGVARGAMFGLFALLD